MDSTVASLLRRTDLFSRASEGELRAAAKVLKETRLHPNQVLFRQGDQADSLYIIASGRLRVSALDRAGHEKVLAFLGAGEIVGEMGLLSGGARSATVTATSDARLLRLRKRDFDDLSVRNPEAMRDLARAVARRKDASRQRASYEASDGQGYHGGLVTTLFSPRGGAGTTTLATNLAVALAHRAPDQVVLLDLNLEFGHVPILLNLLPRTSLAAISAGSVRQMDRENFEFYLTRHAESSLRVLSGTLRPEQSELVTADHARAAIDVARTLFLHVIVDLGRSFSEVNLATIETVHNLLIVCTPDDTAVRGVAESQRIFRELLRLVGDPMHYVLNYPSPYAPIEPAIIENTLGVHLLGSVPFGGDHVARAALEGKPLVTRWPNSPTTRGITRIAERLEQQLAEVHAVSLPEYVTTS